MTQIAISLLLLVAAGLFVRTLSNLQSIESGSIATDVLLFELNAPQAGYAESGSHSLLRRFATSVSLRYPACAPRRCRMPRSSAPAGDTRSPVNGQPTRRHSYSADGTRLLLDHADSRCCCGRAIDDRDQHGHAGGRGGQRSLRRENFRDRESDRATASDSAPASADRPIWKSLASPRRLATADSKGDIPPVVYLPFAPVPVRPVDEMTYALRTNGDPLRYVRHGARDRARRPTRVCR